MKTIKKEAIIEFEIKKSKFIGYIKPIFSKKEAEEFIKKIKNKHSDARHNCSAYKVLEDGQEYYKVDDDGEPSGTAGKPMGEILNILGVENTVVVATRYFGGIKLGAGGLIRNYAKTAKLAVEEAEIVELQNKKNIVIEITYEKSQQIDKILEGEKEIFKEYGERILYRGRALEKTIEKLKEIRNIVLLFN
ncbi:MAG: YigZ family protein [Psychrilyobacter sp.]|nr:YigZ family protein [Psychrilyobacter sp.]